MSKVIYKYPLRITDEQDVDMPVGGSILCVQFQGDTLQLWAVVNARPAVIETRKIVIIGTGNKFKTDDHLAYIGTVQDPSGGFVWHVFEDKS